ncbi:MAG: DUF6455 family protein [Acidiferrobacterales bacterium]
MKKSIKRDREVEFHRLARKLGIELRSDEIRTALDSEQCLHAVESCNACCNLGECRLFQRGEVSAANNKRWWLRGFCPNAELLIKLADEQQKEAELKLI